jgi:hypothetical protein
MSETESGGFDKMSNLEAALKKVEKIHIGDESTELIQTRSSILKIADTYGRSRFALGMLLRQYKQFFKLEHGWVATARVISDALNVDERTIYRIVENYERVSNLPHIIIDEMQKQHIDPAASKNIQIVDDLQRMPEPKTHKEAEAAVKIAFSNHVAAKQAERHTATPPTQQNLEEFATHIVKEFGDRYRPATTLKRDAEIRYVFELVVSILNVDIREIQRYSQPSSVPKPDTESGAVCAPG